jgi:hypothetical protein
MQIRHNYTETLESTCDTFSKGGFYRLRKSKFLRTDLEKDSVPESHTYSIKVTRPESRAAPAFWAENRFGILSLEGTTLCACHFRLHWSMSVSKKTSELPTSRVLYALCGDWTDDPGSFWARPSSQNACLGGLLPLWVGVASLLWNHLRLALEKGDNGFILDDSDC